MRGSTSNCTRWWWKATEHGVTQFCSRCWTPRALYALSY